MSASEKLMALKPEGLVVTDAPYEGYPDAVCLPIATHAAVVAVVEAAEAGVYANRVAAGENCPCSECITLRALAALEDALS